VIHLYCSDNCAGKFTKNPDKTVRLEIISRNQTLFRYDLICSDKCKFCVDMFEVEISCKIAYSCKETWPSNSKVESYIVT